MLKVAAETVDQVIAHRSAADDEGATSYGCGPRRRRSDWGKAGANRHRLQRGQMRLEVRLLRYNGRTPGCRTKCPAFLLVRSGSDGIRTHGGLAPSRAFEARSFGRSDTLPATMLADG